MTEPPPQAVSQPREKPYVVAAALTLVGIAWAITICGRVFGLSWFSPITGTLLLIVFSSVFWWAWVDGLIRRSHSSSASSRRRLVLRVAWGAYTLLTVMPLIMLPVLGHHALDRLPVPAVSWIMAWHLLIVAAGAAAAAVGVARLCWRLTRRIAGKRHAETPVDLSRRMLLARAAAVAPLILTAGCTLRGHTQASAFVVRRIVIKTPRLPSRLRGLTLTHLSDMHLGRLFRPEHLPRMIDAANSLKSDLVLITGDVIDHSNDYLPHACDAMAAMEHRYGRFLVAGNHDLIDNRHTFISYVGRRERLLVDEHTRIVIGGETIQVGGLGWSRREEPTQRDPGLNGRIAMAMQSRDPSLFTIVLSHHPHAFEGLSDRGVDLTLAGHTHGGQLILTPPGFPCPIGAGNLLFRYIWGEYRRGDSAMYVNAGVGNWFPVRINAPAEIVQIRLV